MTPRFGDFGRVRRLTDPDVRKRTDAEHRLVLRSPATARAWLVEHGFLTPGGKLPKKYGGGVHG